MAVRRTTRAGASLASVQVDDSALRELGRQFSPQKVKRIIASASGRAATTTRKVIVRRIGKLFGSRVLKAKELKQRNVRKVRLRDGYGVFINGSRIPVSRMAPQDLKKGVSWAKVGGGRKKAKDAFMGTKRIGSGAGRQSVFSRVGKASHPITELMGPSVPHILANEPGLMKDVEKVAAQELSKQIASKTQAALAGKLKRRRSRGHS